MPACHLGVVETPAQTVLVMPICGETVLSAKMPKQPKQPMMQAAIMIIVKIKTELLDFFCSIAIYHVILLFRRVSIVQITAVSSPLLARKPNSTNEPVPQTVAVSSQTRVNF